ncbi:MAG: heme A synthase [Gammaproteobacteria bacterium]
MMLRRLLLLSCVFALCVVMLGAYTRLTNAGLGCPDWPGCYGHMVVDANVVDSTKAWTEMIHRYFAGALGLLIGGLTLTSCFNARLREVHHLLLLLAGLVVFQAALGMWTVTWKLHPTVVMSHLLGGILIFNLLWLAYLKASSGEFNVEKEPVFKRALRVAVVLVFMQIALGGWTSANYAALACPDFPTCGGTWWPSLDIKKAFQLIHPIGADYEGGVFSSDVRVTIHFMHRLGALCVGTVLLVLAGMSLNTPTLRPSALAVIGLLIIQIMLGISNVIYQLPLPVAVLHNGVAALLLAATITLCFRYDHPRRPYVR